MNVNECENRNKSIMLNAIDWANNKECDPLYILDVLIASEYLNISIPKCFHHFVKTDKLNHATVSGAEKTIFKTLDKLQQGLLKYDVNKLS